jgi:predicted nucleic acid-binding protein
LTLVDTSVWVAHLRRGLPALAERLEEGEVLCHPFVIGEVSLGHLRRRTEILALLAALPCAVLARDLEVLAFVESKRLAGSGIGWVDAHLLASAALSDAPLWTADRRLAATARTLGLV